MTNLKPGQIVEREGKKFLAVGFVTNDEKEETMDEILTLIDQSQLKELEQEEKAVWTTAFINKLPDSAFLYVDKDGKRHLPYRDSTGKVDLPHLRNAIARVSQVKDEEGKRLSQALVDRIQKRARRILEEEQDEKAGRRVRGDKLSLLSSIQEGLDNLKSNLSEFMRWASNADKEPELLPLSWMEGSGIKTVKAKDGRMWLFTFTTNAFVDREGEIFTTKSIQNYVERHRDEDVKGVFQYRHWDATKFGDILWQDVVGRFLVEAGPFDETPVGQKMQDFLEQFPSGHPEIAPEGWGCSHRYRFNGQDREDKVYEWFEKEETTVLPLSIAANPYTSAFLVEKEYEEMNEQSVEQLKTIFGVEVGTTLASKIEAQGQKQTEDLEGNVDFKQEAQEQEAPAEAAPEVTPDETAEVEAAPETEDEKAADIAKIIRQVANSTTDANAKKKLMALINEMSDTEEEQEPKEKEVDSLDRSEIAGAIGIVAETLRAEFGENQKAIVEAVTALAEEIKTLKESDEKKIAQRVEEIPAASLADLTRRAIGQKETQVDGRTTLAKSGPQETAPTPATPTAGTTPVPFINEWISGGSQQAH